MLSGQVADEGAARGELPLLHIVLELFLADVALIRINLLLLLAL